MYKISLSATTNIAKAHRTGVISNAGIFISNHPEFLLKKGDMYQYVVEDKTKQKMNYLEILKFKLFNILPTVYIKW